MTFPTCNFPPRNPPQQDKNHQNKTSLALVLETKLIQQFATQVSLNSNFPLLCLLQPLKQQNFRYFLFKLRHSPLNKVHSIKFQNFQCHIKHFSSSKPISGIFSLTPIPIPPNKPPIKLVFLRRSPKLFTKMPSRLCKILATSHIVLKLIFNIQAR